MTSEQKSDAQSPANVYHLGHWLGATFAVAVVTFGYTLAATNEIINTRNELGLILFPFTAALALALTNRRVLWSGAWFAMPFLFAISMLLCFGGVLVAGALELHKTTDTNALLPILVENIPFFLGGSLLYKGYASLAGRGSFLAWLLTVAWSVVISFAFFRELIKDPNLLFTAFWAGLAMTLSIIHWQQPLRTKSTTPPPTN